MGENHLRIIKAEIESELKILEKLSKNCIDFYEENKNELNSSVNLRVLGSFLHDFYTCVERIFKKIANDIDGELPDGSSWHSTLLERMNLDLQPIRPQVIDKELMELLYDYLRFRHIFRHLYGFELDWDKMQHLVIQIRNTFEEFRQQLSQFLSFIDKIKEQ